MTEENLITQADLSRRLSVSKAAISKLCKKKFEHAMISGKLNLNDPIVAEHIANREAQAEGRNGKNGHTVAGVDMSVRPTKPAPLEIHPLPEILPGIPTDSIHKAVDHVAINAGISAFEAENLTVKQVAIHYGSIAGFGTYVKTMKDISDWKTKEQKLDHVRGTLIERNPVAETLFALVDLAFRRLIEETPKATVAELRAIALSERETASVEMSSLIERANSKILKDCKEKIIKSLGELK